MQFWVIQTLNSLALGGLLFLVALFAAPLAQAIPAAATAPALILVGAMMMAPLADIAPGLTVLGDRNLIAQLLSNLLDNAIKYCAAGDSLQLDLHATGDGHVLRIADTGPGRVLSVISGSLTTQPEGADRITCSFLPTVGMFAVA